MNIDLRMELQHLVREYTKDVIDHGVEKVYGVEYVKVSSRAIDDLERLVERYRAVRSIVKARKKLSEIGEGIDICDCNKGGI